jgi:hypothetical protein
MKTAAWDIRAHKGKDFDLTSDYGIISEFLDCRVPRKIQFLKKCGLESAHFRPGSIKKSSENEFFGRADCDGE